MLRYYLKVEPYDMDYWEIGYRYAELEWIRKEENKANG